MITDDPPRILVNAVPDEARGMLDGLPGTHTYVESGTAVHASDYDLFITFEPAPQLAGEWHVLAFGIESLTLYRSDRRVETARNLETHARYAYTADNEYASKMRRLIEHTILPSIGDPPRLAWNAWYHNNVNGNSYRVSVSGDDFDGRVVPLVHIGAEKQVYAFFADRSGGRYTWALPNHTTEHRAWVLHVLEVLHEKDPAHFPGLPDWQDGTTWAPAALARAHRELADEEVEIEQVLAAARERLATARGRVDAERATAAAGPWRLLTGQGDELVHAVRDALTALGFTAVEYDETHRDKRGRLLEDLRVTDAATPGWEALVEVKGYSKGAKLTEITQVLGAPTSYYVQEKGHEPESAWHIVNVQKDIDPSLREPVRFTETDLLPLAQAHGALIDTRDLFLAWRSVEEGSADAFEVRASLREAVTRWTWKTSPTDDR